jgi:transposase
LEGLTRRGRTSVRQVKRALILLAAADGDRDEAIAAKVRVHANTVQRIRQRFVEESLDVALSERPRPGKARKLAGPQEAFVIALACTDAPEGRQTWTMQLLADRLVELNLVESICDETVRRTLKRGTSSPGSAKSGASPR